MRKLLPGVLASFLLLALPGCDRRHGSFDDGFDFEVLIAGSWSGSVEDSRCGHGEVTFIFVQTGNSVSGSWFISFSGHTTDGCWDPADSGGRISGPLSGSVSGSGLTLSLRRAEGSTACTFTQPITLTGSWTSRRLTGSYSGVSCSANVSGTVDAGR
jgi:hypothetical protein